MSAGHDILVVNDRLLDAQETLFALEQVAPRAKVLHLCSGDEALEYLFSVGVFAGRPAQMPRLVLLSLELRVVSGLCLLELMRAHPLTREIPVVILSLEDHARKHRRHDHFDADAYFRKPLDFQRYCSIIQGCTRRWLPSLLSRNGFRTLERAPTPSATEFSFCPAE
jgi:two-component system, response regulator